MEQLFGGGDGNMLMTLITFGAVILIFYFMIIRPQNKKQKETQRMLAELKKGDKIVTIGGLHGVVDFVDGETVILEVDKNVTLKFSKSAIATVNAPAAPAKDAKTEPEQAK